MEIKTNEKKKQKKNMSYSRLVCIGFHEININVEILSTSTGMCWEMQINVYSDSKSNKKMSPTNNCHYPLVFPEVSSRTLSNFPNLMKYCEAKLSKCCLTI